MGDIKIIASKRNYIDYKSVELLKAIAKQEDIKSVVALPDLSVGSVPNGVAIISKERIYPHFIGGDIGCGMSLFRVDISRKKIKVDRFEKILKRTNLEDIDIDLKLPYNLGTIGRGNHFAEFLVVKDIFIAKESIKKDALYLLIHSGSRAYGQLVFNKVSAKDIKEGISADCAKEYLKEHNLAIAYAKKSRIAIAKRLLKVLKLRADFELISDSAHNSIVKVKDGWLHRKGATPSNSGDVVVAGTRGTLSYLLEPNGSCALSNYSLSHGAGRKWERSKAEAILKSKYKKQELSRTKIGSRVVCSDSSLLYQEAMEAYKDIDIVVDDLVEASLAKKVASFLPILTYKE